MKIQERQLRLWTGRLVFLGSSALAVCALPAAAAEIEEITVTAMKRGASALQGTSETIQVISQDFLNKNRTEGFTYYFGIVPGLSAVNQGPGQTQIVFRGVTAARTTHAQPQDNSTAGMYFDETSVTANSMNPDLDLFDVRRIEVLRGPQGTLYGASAMSGTVRVITNEPRLGKFEGMAEASLSDTKHGGLNHAEKAMLNAPLADKAALRLVAYNTRDKGYIDNIVNGQKGYNNEDKSGFRASVLLQATDNLTLKGSVISQNQKADGRPWEYGVGDPFLLKATGARITDGYQTAKYASDGFKDDFLLYNLTARYDFGGHEFVSSTSYTDRKVNNHLDDSIRVQYFFGPGLQAPFSNDTKIKDFAQELRVARTDKGPLGYVFGLYYQRQEKNFAQTEAVPGSDALFATYGIPPAAVFGAAPNSIFDGTTALVQHQTAAFGEVSYKFTDTLEATLGLRAFSWSQQADIHYAGLVQGGPGVAAGKTTDSGLNPKAKLAYQPSDALLIYASASKGFRLGGINEPMGSVCSKDLAQLGLAKTPTDYKSDQLWNYEVGMKNTLADKRVTLNLAAFRIDWTNIQVPVLLPTCGFTFVSNLPDVRINGLEAELTAAVTNNFNFFANATYTDGQLTSDPNMVKGGTFGAKGDRVPNVPRLKASGGATWSWDMGNATKAFITGMVSYAGSSYAQFNETLTAPNFAVTPKIPSYFSGNLSLGVERNNWTLLLWVKNISNERIVTAVSADRLQPTTYSLAPPRTIGLTANTKF